MEGHEKGIMYTNNGNEVECHYSLLDNEKWRGTIYLRYRDPIEIKRIPGEFKTNIECQKNVQEWVKNNIQD